GGIAARRSGRYCERQRQGDRESGAARLAHGAATPDCPVAPLRARQARTRLTAPPVITAPSATTIAGKNSGRVEPTPVTPSKEVSTCSTGRKGGATASTAGTPANEVSTLRTVENDSIGEKISGATSSPMAIPHPSAINAVHAPVISQPPASKPSASATRP